MAVVSAGFAKRYFGDGVAVGHRIGMGSDPGTPTDIEIVGVAGDARYESLRDEIPPTVYLSNEQLPGGGGGQVIYVRTERDPANAFSSIRAAVREIDPNLPVPSMITLEQQLEESLVSERMIATLSSVFGALATVLAIVGLYGVMAYMVTRRSREIGIRMALGAQSGNVVWLVMREVLALVGAGIAIGVPAAWALSKLVQAQLYGVSPHDPASIALPTLLLAAVALLAGYIPARRAAGMTRCAFCGMNSGGCARARPGGKDGQSEPAQVVDIPTEDAKALGTGTLGDIAQPARCGKRHSRHSQRDGHRRSARFASELAAKYATTAAACPHGDRHLRSNLRRSRRRRARKVRRGSRRTGAS